ncbi:hypothetical protein SNE40_012296 [Patella caerulea]
MSSRCHNCEQNCIHELIYSSTKAFRDFNNNPSKCPACILLNSKQTKKVPGGSDTFRRALAETENMEQVNNNRIPGNEGSPVLSKGGLKKRFNDFKESSKNDFLGKISGIKDKFCESKKLDKHSKRTVRWADEKKGMKLVTVHVLRPRLSFATQASSPIVPRSILRAC